jgi:hypothetical protein
MKHMCGDNIALITSRLTKGEEYAHVLVTRNISEKIVLSAKTSNNGFHFPLYLYPTAKKQGLFGDEGDSGDWPAGKDGRVPNLSKGFVEAVAEKTGMEFLSEKEMDSRLRGNDKDGSGNDNKGGKGKKGENSVGVAHPTGKTFTPEDVFYWIYGVFHSPQYRQRYAEFLKIDFPRVPLPKDGRQFAEVCDVGRELVALHLMEAEELDDKKQQPVFPEKGTGEVEAGYPRYVNEIENSKIKIKNSKKGATGGGESLIGQPQGAAPTKGNDGCTGGRVYINEGQYFEGIEPAVWEFTIGGYQVCEKWLKDRRGRALSFDDIQHYQKIVAALRETMRLMADERLRIFGS